MKANVLTSIHRITISRACVRIESCPHICQTPTNQVSILLLNPSNVERNVAVASIPCTQANFEWWLNGISLHPGSIVQLNQLLKMRADLSHSRCRTSRQV